MLDIFGIHCAQTRLWWMYIPLAGILVWLLIRNAIRLFGQVQQLVHHRYRRELWQHFAPWWVVTKLICYIVAIILIGIAFLRPQWGKTDSKVTQEGRDVVIVLDVSRSMLASDVSPNRLEFAKLKIRDLLSHLSFERVGLVLFSGSAFVACPLTSDYSAFLMFLDQVDVHSISSGTTALDKALRVTQLVFTEGSARKNKLVVLLTDGEDFSTDLASAKRWAHREHVRLFALGVGTPQGAPVPIINASGKQEGHEVDAQGKIILTALNEKLLSDITSDLGGTYLRARPGEDDVEDIARRLSTFERERFEEREISRYREQYHWFLAAALILLLIEWVL